MAKRRDGGSYIDAQQRAVHQIGGPLVGAGNVNAQQTRADDLCARIAGTKPVDAQDQVVSHGRQRLTDFGPDR